MFGRATPYVLNGTSPDSKSPYISTVAFRGTALLPVHEENARGEEKSPNIAVGGRVQTQGFRLQGTAHPKRQRAPHDLEGATRPLPPSARLKDTISRCL